MAPGSRARDEPRRAAPSDRMWPRGQVHGPLCRGRRRQPASAGGEVGRQGPVAAGIVGGHASAPRRARPRRTSGARGRGACGWGARSRAVRRGSRGGRHAPGRCRRARRGPAAPLPAWRRHRGASPWACGVGQVGRAVGAREDAGGATGTRRPPAACARRGRASPGAAACWRATCAAGVMPSVGGVGREGRRVDHERPRRAGRGKPCGEVRRRPARRLASRARAPASNDQVERRHPPAERQQARRRTAPPTKPPAPVMRTARSRHALKLRDAGRVEVRRARGCVREMSRTASARVPRLQRPHDGRMVPGDLGEVVAVAAVAQRHDLVDAQVERGPRAAAAGGGRTAR